MSLEQIELGLQDFSNAGGPVFSKLVDDSNQIQEVAESLHLRLPTPVSQFYQKYECIAYGPEELLAIDQIAEHHHCLTSRRRPIPRHYLPFIADGGGGYYVVVCALRGEGDDSEFGNILYVPGFPPFDIEFRSSDFAQFLVDRLRSWKDEI